MIHWRGGPVRRRLRRLQFLVLGALALPQVPVPGLLAIALVTAMFACPFFTLYPVRLRFVGQEVTVALDRVRAGQAVLEDVVALKQFWGIGL